MPRTAGDLPPELSATFNVQLDESFPQACGKTVENGRSLPQTVLAKPQPREAKIPRARYEFVSNEAGVEG